MFLNEIIMLFICFDVNNNDYIVSIILYLTSQWYVSTITVRKVILLVIHLTNINMKSLMELTSLLFVETLSDSDHIKVYVANNSSANCTGEIHGAAVSATISQRFMIEKCIDKNLNATSNDTINVKCLCQNFNNR